MRAEVAESWQRSAAAGVRVDRIEAPLTLPVDTVRDHREAHPLAEVFPLLDDVLGQAARDCGAIMAVSDAAGQLLWVCGGSEALRAAEAIGFVEGSNWDERLAGTNAPGLALALDRTAVVHGAEHFRQSVRRWSCAAAPIHDPASSTLLAVLDLTGGEEVVGPQSVALVRAAARMAEAEMARALLSRRSPVGPGGQTGRSGLHVAVEALGRSEALVRVGAATTAGARPLRLSRRHSELLVLLASAPHGLSGDELAVLLYDEDSGGSTPRSTLRAELNRLRHLLGPELLASRPYRVQATVSADWLAVEAMVAAGDVVGASRLFRGPLLPRSSAPGVARCRDQVTSVLRASVLSSGDADLMSTWTRSAWGRDDRGMWLAQRTALLAGQGPTSPLAVLAEHQVARLAEPATTGTTTGT